MNDKRELQIIFPTIISYQQNIFSENNVQKIIELCYKVKDNFPEKT